MKKLQIVFSVKFLRLLVLAASTIFLSQTVSAQSETEEALAAQYFQNGEFDKSVVLYRKLFNDGRNPVFYDPYFNVLLKLKQYDEAGKVVKKLIKNNPGTYSFQVDYGRILREQGNEEKADEWFTGLVNGVPKNEAAIRDLANTFYRADGYDYAVKTFLSGRKLLGDNTAFAFELISLYRYQKNKVMLIDEYLNVLETNPEVMQTAKNVFGNTFDSNADYELLKGTLLRRIQKNPQNVAYSELLTWQYLQQKEFDMALRQAIALDKRLKESGDRIYDLAGLLLSNQAYSTAVDALQYLIGKGTENSYYIPAKVQLLNTKNQMLTSGKFTLAELQQLEKEYLSLLTEVGRTSGSAFAIQQLANLQAFYLDKAKEAQTLLESLLQQSSLPASVKGQTKLDLGNIYILTGEVWEAALIYGQVEKEFPGQPMGQEAKFRNARLSYFQGDFTWSKAQVDVLKSSTSQLIANDALNLGLLITENTGSAADTAALKSYSRADMLIFKNQFPAALAALDSIGTSFPKNTLSDDILMAKARIFIKQGDLMKAAQQLETIANNYRTELWADDAVFMLGDLYETKFNNPEKAKAFFEKIITDYPSSLYVIEARKRFRNLRGDKLGS